jgi:carbohydrate diacid regulator
MKDVTNRTIGVIDPEGLIIASSDLSILGNQLGGVPTFESNSGESVIVRNGKTFKSLDTEIGHDYSVFVDGNDELSSVVCSMAAITLNEAGTYFEGNHDKRAFVKSIVCENILLGDISLRAKELRLQTDTPRGVIVVRHGATLDLSAVELLQDTFPDKQRDFIFSVNNNDIVLVKEIPETAESDYLFKFAETIEQKLRNELALKCIVGIGTQARHLRELSERYKEAIIAIDVGRVFESAKTIISYENLGIGRLIYQLPTTLCEIFLSEVFKKNPIEALDQETLFTIDKFFENSLNVSETSRKLFVHRNTLVYRLEKIKKITGLDLREFDHAIIFKVALMVKIYLLSQESKY